MIELFYSVSALTKTENLSNLWKISVYKILKYFEKKIHIVPC